MTAGKPLFPVGGNVIVRNREGDKDWLICRGIFQCGVVYIAFITRELYMVVVYCDSYLDCQ